MLKKLTTLMVYVRDMGRAVAFYRDVLGLPLQMESPGWSQLDLGGGLVLGLHAVMSQMPAPAPGWVPTFAVDDVKGAKERLEAAGAAITLDYRDVPGGNGVFIECADPDGNRISLMQTGVTTAGLGIAS